MDAKSIVLVQHRISDGKAVFRRGTIVFQNGGSGMDFLIRVGQGFRGYTHVGVALGDGTMIASFLPSGGVTLQNDIQQIQAIEGRPYPGDSEKLISNMLSFKGDGYDLLGLLVAIGGPGFGSGPPKKFTCSSLIAYCANWKMPVRGVTPEQIWQQYK